MGSKTIQPAKTNIGGQHHDSTTWTERYHEQCSKIHDQSLQIERAATSLGSKLTYLDLRAQIQSLGIKCNSLGTDLRDSERSVSMHSVLSVQLVMIPIFSQFLEAQGHTGR